MRSADLNLKEGALVKMIKITCIDTEDVAAVSLAKGSIAPSAWKADGDLLVCPWHFVDSTAFFRRSASRSVLWSLPYLLTVSRPA